MVESHGAAPIAAGDENFLAIDGWISRSITFSEPKLSQVAHQPPNLFKLKMKGDLYFIMN